MLTTIGVESTFSAVCNQIIAHSRSESFKQYYVNQVVNLDVMSIYFERLSKDAYNPLASQKNLTRYPIVLANICESELFQIHDPDIKILAISCYDWRPI